MPGEQLDDQEKAALPGARSARILLIGGSIQLAIDDFSTAYSSLSYLKQLAMQTLKINSA